MNICFFSDIGALGGGELWAIRTCHTLRARGHRPLIACPYRSRLYQEALRQGLDVYAYYNVPGSPFQEPLYHALRRHETDVVYVTVIGALCERALLEPIVERLNRERTQRRAILVLKTGLPPMTALPAEYYGADGSPVVRRLHVVSDDSKRAFLDQFDDDRDAWDAFIDVVHEGADLARFDPTDTRFDREQARDRLRTSLDVDAGHVLITCLARLSAMKGIDNLLLAAADVLRAEPRCRFVIAGDGEERTRLDDLRRHLGLQDAVRFLGHVDDTPTLLAASDIVCHPSLADGLPNAVVEAMAMARAIVATAVGGTPEVITHEETGLLVPSHDVRALGKAVLRLVREPETVRRLGRNARARIVDEFDHNRNVDALVQRLEIEQMQFDADPRRRLTPRAPLVPAPTPVLFLMNVFRTGGEETEAALLATHLDRRRFTFSVLSAWSVDEPAPARRQLDASGVTLDTHCHTLPDADAKIAYIVDTIRRERIRVVIASQDTQLAYHVFQHLTPSECRLIEHAGIAEEVSRCPKDRTSRLIGVSQAIADRAAPLMPSPERAICIPSMVDPAAYDLEDRGWLRDGFSFGDDIIVTFVGRLDAKKGVQTLIDAAARLLPRHARLRFLIVGGVDGYQPDTAQALMRDARERCGQRFVFAGARSDVARLLSASDIFVLPARGEGMSHAINEAGAAGLAVVATDDGAAREQLEDGEAGVLVPWNDADALAGAIERLALDEDLRRRLGGRLKQRVLDRYGVPRVLPRWEAVLADVAAEATPTLTAPALRVSADVSLPPFPLEIQIETNTACNATCIMCPYPEVSKELPAGRMDRALYDSILDQCASEPSVWRLEPFLNNEPFTDVRMVEWIALAKQRVPQALVTVTTNGSLVTPKIADRLVQSGLDAIWFSFNGSTKATYERIMGLSFDKVKSNIDYLLAVKPASLRVFTNMIETEPMKDEIAENIAHWRGLGVESGSSPLVNRAGNVRNFDDLNYQPVGADAVRICDLLFHKMYIGYNGDVLLCCMDWRRRVVLGNVRRQSLREIWHGDLYRHYRQLHVEGRARELDLCRECTYVCS